MDPAENVILHIEDDENDALLLQHAFTQAGISQALVVVRDGQAAMDYLAGDGAPADHPLPCLVLLDLNMPGGSGIDVLKWIRRTPSVSTLPVVVLTASKHDGDIHRAYLQGANGYLVKPNRLEDIIAMARAIKDYWLVQNRGSVRP